MTPLERELIQQISTDGPMPVSEYMQHCLLHPVHGYYTQSKVFGAEGDFITAPDISQMFGELVGLSLAQTWIEHGMPAPFHLLELGPGQGTLMSDVLRATRSVPGFHAAAQIRLIEASPRLREVQKHALAEYDVTWHDDISQIPEGPLFVLANEFFDALPVRQFIKSSGGWTERVIGVQKGMLEFGQVPCAIVPQRVLEFDAQLGDLVELAVGLDAIVQSIGDRINAFGGAALIFDYGDWMSLGDTLQAVQNHRPTLVLDTPGEADLTAHVDFAAIAAAAPCAYTRLTPQGVFLERLGITARAQMLAKNLSGDALDRHIAAHRRLTHPDEMGSLFKVMGLYPKDKTPPPGLEK
jgi:SAM-dependent MidA family methyltransferase